ncbi:MAG: T9SS type A sorting domain-containing protein [Chitinophagales bacterium]
MVNSLNVLGQAGILDSSFSDDGIVTMFPNGYGNSVAIQPDGKIVVGAYDGTVGFGVARFNNDGTLDNTFTSDGFTKVSVGLGSEQNESVAIQSDGKIVAGGTCLAFDGYWNCSLIRLNANGTLDNSFNGGKVLYSYSDPHLHSNACFGIAITPDQKIVTVGYTSSATGDLFATARFNSNGTLDNTFGTNGIVLTAVGNKFAHALALRVQTDGKIIVAGSSYMFGAPCSFGVVRYNTDGSLDNEFGTGGIDTIYFGAGGASGDTYDFDVARCIAIQSDNKFILAGSSKLGSDTFSTVAVAKYLSNGTLDESFGSVGKTRIIFPNHNYTISYGVANQQDHKVVITGSCSNNPYDGTLYTLRLLENGILDNQFGTNGIHYTAIDNNLGNLNWGKSVAINDEQNIIVAGQSYQGMTVLQYLSGLEVGILDLSIPNKSIFIYPNPFQDAAVLKYSLLKDEIINVRLFDMNGVLVQSFINGESRNRGSHEEVLRMNQLLPFGDYILQIGNSINFQSIRVIVK